MREKIFPTVKSSTDISALEYPKKSQAIIHNTTWAQIYLLSFKENKTFTMNKSKIIFNEISM